jgi:hypothetical protein
MLDGRGRYPNMAHITLSHRFKLRFKMTHAFFEMILYLLKGRGACRGACGAPTSSAGSFGDHKPPVRVLDNINHGRFPFGCGRADFRPISARTNSFATFTGILRAIGNVAPCARASMRLCWLFDSLGMSIVARGCRAAKP